ncbi:MAG: patatin [Deltaproteobacteria bacterium]|nr:MAG: patatin [Deltaproteobacteria bacterium]
MSEVAYPPRPPGRLGVALGGGGARGWAHIGVLRVLEEAGWSPDVVAGTSMGSLVGAAAAAGELDALEAWARSLSWRQVVGYLDLGGEGGVIRGERVLDDFLRLLPTGSIAELPRPFGAVATSLMSGREVWLSEGSVRDAVRASIAIPGLIAPVPRDGRWLADGGLVNPVPVTLCRALGASTVVAVDLQAMLLDRRRFPPPPGRSGEIGAEARPAGDGTPGEVDAPAAGAESSRLASFDEWWRRLRRRSAELFGERGGESYPSLFEVISASINIMQLRIARSRLAGDPPELLVTPWCPEIGLMDFHEAARAIEAGAEAARRALTRYGETVRARH